jgi:hypothetical protein
MLRLGPVQLVLRCLGLDLKRGLRRLDLDFKRRLRCVELDLEMGLSDRLLDLYDYMQACRVDCLLVHPSGLALDRPTAVSIPRPPA